MSNESEDLENFITEKFTSGGGKGCKKRKKYSLENCVDSGSAKLGDFLVRYYVLHESYFLMMW